MTKNSDIASIHNATSIRYLASKDVKFKKTYMLLFIYLLMILLSKIVLGISISDRWNRVISQFEKVNKIKRSGLAV